MSVSKQFVSRGGIDRFFSPLEVLALEDVDLQHETGKTLVVRGDSGSGKSVLLNLLCGIYAPDEGTVRVFGKDPTRRNQPPHDISLVRPDAQDLDPGLSARRNLETLAGFWDLSNEQARERIGEVLDFVELPVAMEGVPLGEYPPGLKARASLAAGLIPSPDLLLLDDPAQILDEPGRKQLRALLKGLAAQDVTLVLATSETKYQALADQELYLEDGVVVDE